MNFKNVLVLAPHTDDGELGAGGFISKLIKNGSSVTYVAFSVAQESVPTNFPKDILKTEVSAATCVLGIKPENLIILNYPVRKFNFHRQQILEDLILIRSKCEYDLVLIPSINDVHQDHQTIALEAVRAFKKTTMISYELLWNNISFNNSCLISLSEENIQDKVSALSCYKSQGARDYMSSEFIYSLAKVRGVQIGTQYAECFEVVRWVIN